MTFSLSQKKKRGREKCGKCDHDLNRRTNSTIPCQGCNRCFHKDCFGIPAEVIEVLKDTGYVMYCQSCNTSCKKMLVQMNELQSRMDALEMKTNKNTGAISVVETKIDEHEDRIGILEKGGANREDVSCILHELNDQERRKANFMITGIRESTSTESQKRVAHDMRMVIDVCNELEKSIKKENIVRCYRIGKRSPRHMIVRLRRKEDCQSIIQSGRALKSSKQFKEVRIRPDLTRNQMKVLSKCHEEVIAKNEAEGGNGFKWIVKQDRGLPRVVRIKAEDPMRGKGRN